MAENLRSSPNNGNTLVGGSTVNYDKLARNRAACKKWRENNKEKIKEKAKALRATVEFKIKRNKKLKEKRLNGCTKQREYQKKYRLENPDKIKKYVRSPDKRKDRKRKDKEKARANIANEYVKILLSNKLGIPYGDVKKYPKLIELHREIIKIKRYAKQNEN